MTLLRSDLLRALREPAAMAAFGADTWDVVVRQAASAGSLSGRRKAWTRPSPRSGRSNCQAIQTFFLRL